MIRALTAAALLLFATDASAALNAYLVIEGETQGPIAGGAEAGREDSIQLFGWSHEVVSPRDAASGLPTGKRQHKPFTITKAVDKATPLIMNALTQNENLTTVRIDFYRQARGGADVLWYSIELSNAAIAGVGARGGRNIHDLKQKPLAHNRNLEEVSFVYERITWTYHEGGVTAEDDWSAPSDG